jgi:hypothetical protein
MTHLEDYIEQCMADTQVEATREDFQTAFCRRCLNPDCQRSSYQGSAWKHRMDRQLQGLNAPVFMPEAHPLYTALSQQDFISFEAQKATLRGGDWLVGDPVIHQGQSEVKRKDSTKLEEAQKGLSHMQGKELSATDPAMPEESSLSPEVDTVVKVEAPPSVSVPTPTQASPPKDVYDNLTSYNTQAPSKGVMLIPDTPPETPTARPEVKVERRQADAWSVAPAKEGNTKSKGRSTRLKVTLGKKKSKDT